MTDMGSEEGKRGGELSAAECIVELPLFGEPGTATGDERLGRLARAAVIDDSDLRRQGSQSRREDIDVAGVEPGRRQAGARLGGLEPVSDRVAERKVVLLLLRRLEDRLCRGSS